MEFKLTAKGKLRGTKPEVATDSHFHIIKCVSLLRATYQIKLLTYFAVRDRKTLTIHLLKTGRLHHTLEDLMKKAPGTIEVKWDV